MSTSSVSEKLFVHLVYATCLIHLGQPRQNCFLFKVIAGKNVAYYKNMYARLIGLDYSEPDLPFEDSTENIFDNRTRCGRPAIDIKEAIMNGHDAPEKAWPWQVCIFSRKTDNKTTLCGGSLISDSWVLTAAHCTLGIEMLLLLGITDLTTMKKNVSTTQVRRPAKIIAHKGFRFHHNDDIALVKLNSPAVFTEYVQPICLPGPGQTFEDGEDGECYTTGWGTSHSAKPMLLQQAKVNIMPQSLCIFSCFLMKGYKDWRNVCLDQNDEKIGTCHGDSGGPLVCKVDGRFILAGVTQSGPGINNCSHPIMPSIDVRVTAYLEWITITVKENEQ